jgi:hypothetical protein
MHAGNYGGDQSTKEVCQRIGIDYDTEGSIIGQYLRGEDLVTWSSFDWISLTPKGRRGAESIVDRRYAEKEHSILQKIYDMSGPDHARPVAVPLLVSELGLPDREVSLFLKDFAERRLVDWAGGDVVQMLAVGIKSLVSQESNLQSTNITNIHGPNYGAIQQGTSNSTQSITITNYQPIGEILPQLAELIEAVRAADFQDKDDALRDLEKAQELALANPNATPKEGVWNRILAKVTAAKTTMEIAGMAYKSLPYWPLVWEFLHQHLQ